MRKLLVSLLACAAAAPVHAQDPPFRASVRSQFDLPVTFADVWGEGSFAYMGRFGANGVEFLDASDPDNVQQVLTYMAPAPNTSISAQELKAQDGLLYLALGGGNPDSVQIIDIRNPLAPVPLTNVAIAGFPAPHNIFIDAGWLYLCNGAGDGIAIVDLTGYDPDSPPASISSAAWVVTGAGSVHDITVVGNRMYVSDIGGSQKVYDVGNLATTAPTLLGSIRGGSVHSSWPTADHAFVVTADESRGGPLKLMEIVDTGTVQLVQRDSWLSPFTGVGASSNAHNPVVDGNRVYVANNAGGVLCLQIDRTSLTWELVASFDTSTVTPVGATGEGCWGIYPFFGADEVLASDRQSGFWMLDFSALEITFDAARPRTLQSGQANALDVTITELGSIALDAATVRLHTSVNGAPFVATPMVSTGGSGWQASFPVLGCGDRLDYYVTADSTGGDTFSRPGQAPGEVYTTFGVTNLTTVFEDDFETDKGWTAIATAQVQAGFFERGVPVDNGYQPPFDDPDGTGTRCWVTQIGTGGNDDLDGGMVAIVSPVMDFSGRDGLISYARWFYNNDSNSAQATPLLVELSNDAGENWSAAESVLLDGGGWKRHAFRISDVLPPTALMQVRFVVSDEPNNTLVEAGVDSFLAEAFGYLAATATRNGGVNPLSYTASTALLGGTLTATVDNNVAGQLTSVLFAFDAPFTLTLGSGQTLLCLDLFGGGELFTGAGLSPASAAGGVDQYSLPIPNDCLLGGFELYSQAIQFGSPPFQLSNAQDLTVGSF